MNNVATLKSSTLLTLADVATLVSQCHDSYQLMSSLFLANVATLDNVATLFIQCHDSFTTLLNFCLFLLLFFKSLQNIILGEDSIISH